METPASTPSAPRTRTAKRRASQRGWLWTVIDRLRAFVAPSAPPESIHSARCLKKLADGSRVEFDRGTFDEWCVFVTRPRQPRHAPRDTDYFETLKDLHARFPRLHADFVEVFKRTTAKCDLPLFAHISKLAAQYPDDARTEVDVLLTTLCAAMIAEENRAHAPLGKRIKRLAVHQVLVEKMPVELAANFSRGIGWRELDRLCRERGF